MSAAIWKEWATESKQDALRREKQALRIVAEGGSSSEWPTPTGIHAQRGNHDEPLEKFRQRMRDCYEGRAKGKPGMSTGVAVREWPTPTHRDWKGTYTTLVRKDGKPRGDLLPDAVNIASLPDRDRSSTNGSRHGPLNPDWVETLMGTPQGWTAFACSATE